jgi:preprotein translocase subunit YajC
MQKIGQTGGIQVPTSTGSSTLPTILMIVAMVAIFYFFLIRPENKKKKKLAEMRSNLSVGDKITTLGGIIGTVVHMDKEEITFETGEDRVRVKVAKWAISTVNQEETTAPQK